jgi:diaminohydroxyphosphoribosylaminopyrimidine deaminase/5-amino-6-(5-phosphoribosylamino)uracil reductase
MRLALELARRPRNPPYPNPWVGCVIVKRGQIVGRGWHCGPGKRHAEVAALAQAGARARGATLYVTLEPCCHHGRTAPCTDALIRAGVSRVVYAMRDPNPLVSGRGARLLRRQGISVAGGICAEEARSLNEVYLKFRKTGLPFVSIKVAASLDGKTATRAGRSKWITESAARRRGLRIRARHQAILVGITTILKDNPHLGPRQRGAADTLRVILDSRLRTPPGSQVMRTRRCVVACSTTASRFRRARLERLGAQVWHFPGRRVPLRGLLARLAGLGIISVLAEGGSEVLGSLLDARLVDRAYWFVSPKIIGSKGAKSAIGGTGAAWPSQAAQIQDPRIEAAGNGWLIIGKVAHP